MNENNTNCNAMQEENKKAVAWLTLGHGMADSYSGFINPILPFIVANIGTTLAAATCALSASQLFSSMMQPVFGFIADKWRKRFFIFWGIILASIFFSLTGLVQNIWQLALCLILGGVGVGFYHPQATGFVVRYSGKNLAKYMSIFIAAGTIGYSVGPIISSSITQFFGVTKLPLAASWGILFALAVFLFVPKISHQPVPKDTTSFKTAVTNIFKNKTVRILIMVSALKSLVTSSFSVLLPFYWKSLGYSAFQIGIAVFLFLTVGAFGTYISSKYEKLIGYKNVFYTSLIVPFILTLVFVSLMKLSPVLSFILFILTGFVTMLSVSINMVMAQKTMPQYKSMISGFIAGFSWGIVGVMLPLIGFVAQNVGIIKVLVVIAFIPFVLSYFVRFLPDAQSE
ncbi:MAG: MFS transporter [Candidatus Gastranaerophilaceae bacterium]|jgi:putative membrane efflux protein